MHPADFIPLYARIQRFLRDEIASGRLQEGDRTPSEPELAERFGTTRATVSRAFQDLVFEGIIVRRAGSGTFVAPRRISAPIDLTHVRSFEEQLAATGAAIQYELVGFSRRQASPSEAETLHLDGDDNLYLLDRLRVVAGKKMSLESRIIPEELGRHMTLDMLQTKSMHRILADDFHLPVHRVEGKIRADIAKPAIADRLEVKRGSPVLIRDYVLFSADRRPLVSGESIYRSEFQIDYLVQQAN
ncbi:transcriptional regulator, GntR family [Faunimonas pinastri]|uniref:Transcriptional regulator, GntR family n=1 Tax=Faunimonas pinastri TaxID=1855383 RepID=A0A1H9B6B1_9HYPH|nr:GntR family transcriptional regulator [Faunimonas pinastri]SEP84484.1 transcriptional regulator, GntR family [Faunimonas pinastri]